MVELANNIILVVFTGLFVIGATTTLIRRLALGVMRRRSPRLLPRDVAMMSGLAWPFVLILMSRAFGWTPYVVGTLWWTLITGIPPIFGVGVYVFFEIFVIGQPMDWRVVLRSIFRRTTP